MPRPKVNRVVRSMRLTAEVDAMLVQKAADAGLSVNGAVEAAAIAWAQPIFEFRVVCADGTGRTVGPFGSHDEAIAEAASLERMVGIWRIRHGHTVERRQVGPWGSS